MQESEHNTSHDDTEACQQDNVDEGCEGGTAGDPEQLVDNSLKRRRQQTATGTERLKPKQRKQKQLLATDFSESVKDRLAVTAPKQGQIDAVIASLDNTDIGGNDDPATLNVRSEHVETCAMYCTKKRHTAYMEQGEAKCVRDRRLAASGVTPRCRLFAQRRHREQSAPRTGVDSGAQAFQ